MSGISILSYLLLTLSIGYAFVYPAIGDISFLKQEKQKYLQSLETVRNIENKTNELLTQFNNIPPEERAKIDIVLPDSFEFVKIVHQIDNVAAKYGISIDDISSAENTFSASNSIEQAEPEKPYNSATIKFSFTSSYENFLNFLNDLERSLRILDLKSVKLLTEEGGTYSYEVELETHWLKS